MPEEFDKSKIKIGFKEVMSLISENKAAKVFIAEDCEDSFRERVTETAAAHGTECELVSSMKELGSLCGIDVGASCAAVIR